MLRGKDSLSSRETNDLEQQKIEMRAQIFGINYALLHCNRTGLSNFFPQCVLRPNAIAIYGNSMSSDLLLGIDLGTSATKFILLDSEHGVVSVHSENAGWTAPRPGMAEADAEMWWSNVIKGVPRLINKVPGVTGRSVAAIGVAGMVPALILEDSNGVILRPSIQQNDARASLEIEHIQNQTVASEILARTGSTISSQSIAPKLRWLAEHEPKTLAKTRTIRGSYDLISGRLAGARVVELNWAIESGLYDFARCRWDPEMVKFSGVDANWLPPVEPPTKVVGTLLPKIAALLGLREGIAVVAGSADHVASAFSAGIANQGDLLVKLGTACDILAYSSKPVVDERLFFDAHLIEGAYLPNGCMAAGGNALTWFRDNFAAGTDFRLLDNSASSVPPGSLGLLFLPYLLGEKTPIFDPCSRGTLIGLTLSHGRSEAFRSILEGLSYAIRSHVAVFREIGLAPARVRCTNGGANSALWRQITADVLGLPLEFINNQHGSAMGAAYAAGMAIGAFNSWLEIERFINIEETTFPQPRATAVYDDGFELWLETYARLKTMFPYLCAQAEK